MLSFASLSDYIVSTAQRCGGGGLLLLERQEGHVVIRKLQPQVIIVLHMECGRCCLLVYLVEFRSYCFSVVHLGFGFE